MSDISKQINLLCEKDNKTACKAMKDLQAASEKSDCVYPYMEHFIKLMENESSYIRTRGLTLFACNAKWDSGNQIDKFIDRYLRHITDKKPITSRQCIQLLPLIAKYKPALSTVIAAALSNADTSIYSDSMRPLVDNDSQDTLKKIRISQK